MEYQSTLSLPLFLKTIFPFLHLIDPPKRAATEEEEDREALLETPVRIYLAGIVLWTISAALTSYILLVIGSWVDVKPVRVYSNNEATTKWAVDRLSPDTGHYFILVVGLMRIIEIVILHRLCIRVMEPVAGLQNQRYKDLHEMYPTGVLHGLRKLWSKIFCIAYRERWLSSFTMDHILLLLAAVSMLVSDYRLTKVKLYAHEHVFLYPSSCDVSSWIVKIALAVRFYRCITLVGFLYVTLEFNIVAKRGKRVEFNILVFLQLIGCIIDFFQAMLDRHIYLGMWFLATEDAHKYTTHFGRQITALGQIFYTHSAAMLGAVLFGHAGHFKKAPDFTCRFVWRVLLPFVSLALLLYYFARMSFDAREWPVKALPVLDWVARPYHYFMVLLASVGGGLLLILALKNERVPPVQVQPSISKKADGTESTEFVEYTRFTCTVDYDSALIIGVFMCAILYNIVTAYEAFAAGESITLVGRCFGILAPIGFACYALGAWRALSNNGLHNISGLPFAWVFGILMFAHVQIREDCTFSSFLPACCDFPSYPDWNDARRETCYLSRRCRQKREVHYPGGTAFTYCSNPSHHHEDAYCGSEDVLSEAHHTHRVLTAHETHGDTLHQTHHASDCCCCEETWIAMKKCPTTYKSSNHTICDAQHPDEDCDEELSCRWLRFNVMGFNAVEYFAHMKTESTSFRLLESLGMAATIEFFFTCLGVILKVALYASHPNAERIVQLDAHHHQVDNFTGEGTVVAHHPTDRGHARLTMASVKMLEGRRKTLCAAMLNSKASVLHGSETEGQVELAVVDHMQHAVTH